MRWNRGRGHYRQFRRGHLWLSRDNGIMQFDPVRLTTRTYTVQEGITHNEFNRIAHHQDAQGRLYFWGLNGVQKAEELLKDSSLSIAEVASAVCFDNPRYFSRIFSDEKGISPSSFRASE